MKAVATADLREWVALLEREGELVRITAEVDPDLEVTEIVDRTVKSGGPALLFENPKGAKPRSSSTGSAPRGGWRLRSASSSSTTLRAR